MRRSPISSNLIRSGVAVQGPLVLYIKEWPEVGSEEENIKVMAIFYTTIFYLITNVLGTYYCVNQI